MYDNSTGHADRTVAVRQALLGLLGRVPPKIKMASCVASYTAVWSETWQIHQAKRKTTDKLYMDD
jgi:hypothetical protein